MLRKVYCELNDFEKFNDTTENINLFPERYWVWIQQMLAEDNINCTKEIFSAKKLKCILNGYICKKN